MIRKIALAAVPFAAVVVVAVPGPAEASAPPTGQVTAAEFAGVGIGETRLQVRDQWGATGQVILRGLYTTRWYVTDSSPYVALVTYTRDAAGHWRVVEKQWVNFT